MRRIVLQLADDTTETHCGRCEHVSFARSVLIIDGRSHQAYECRLTGEELHPGREPLRTDACRSAELRPETVDVVRSELGYIVRNFREDDPNRIAWADALADFERLFGVGE